MFIFSANQANTLYYIHLCTGRLRHTFIIIFIANQAHTFIYCIIILIANQANKYLNISYYIQFESSKHTYLYLLYFMHIY